MRCDYTIFVRGVNFNVSVVVDHSYRFSSALSVHQISGNDVAVIPGFQVGVHVHFEIELFIVEHDKSAITTTKGDLIATVIVPPKVDRGPVDDVAELHHVVDLTPPVFADPAVATGIVRIDDRGQYVAVVVRRWAVVEVLEIVGAHYTWVPVIMR